jgi:transposase
MSSLEKIIKNCARIDIGSEKVFVAIEEEEVRSFRTFTRSYRELGAYLQNHSITHVAMESTGVYWITLYDILEEMGFDARKIAELYYKTFDNGMQYVEKGVEIYLQQQQDQQIRFLTKKAKELNIQLIDI